MGVEEKSAGEKGVSKKQQEEEEIDMVFSVVVNFRKWLLTREKRENKSLVKITNHTVLSVIGVNLSEPHTSKLNQSSVYLHVPYCPGQVPILAQSPIPQF